MKSLNRREFLDTAKKTSLGLAAGVTILQSAKSARGYPANEKVILASVGLGGRGPHLAAGFLERDDCEIAYGCDPNSKQFAKAKAFEKQQGKAVKCVQDFRQALDDPAVDAIVSATPVLGRTT